MISIKLCQVVAKVGNLSLFSGATAVQSRSKSRTFTINLAVFVPQPRPVEGSINDSDVAGELPLIVKPITFFNLS